MMNKKLISAVFALVSLFSLAFIPAASAGNGYRSGGMNGLAPNGITVNGIIMKGVGTNGWGVNGTGVNSLKSEASLLQSLASQSLGVVVKTETAK